MNYKELLNDFPPRPITTEEQFNLTRNRLDEILDILFDRGFTQDERDYLTILGTVAIIMILLSETVYLPYHDVTCMRDNEIVYVNRTQDYPNIEYYDSCYIEAVTEE